MNDMTKPKKKKREKLTWTMRGKGPHEGTHEYLRGSRLFVLTSASNGARTEFSSHQAAKAAGWVGGR